MEPISIKVESSPKSASVNEVHTQHFEMDNLIAVRNLIVSQRKAHQKDSRWFKIYQNNKLIFDSKHIRK